jgi:hypothetical protein
LIGIHPDAVGRDELGFTAKQGCNAIRVRQTRRECLISEEVEQVTYLIE